MNTLPPPTSLLKQKDGENKGLLELNYTRHWRTQIHNRLGSGVFVPKRQRIDSDFPGLVRVISVKDNNIHNDLDLPVNGHTKSAPDLELYGGDEPALCRDVLISLLARCTYNHPSYIANLTEQFLARLSTAAPLPTYEQYAEVLPKISPFERDIFLRKIFKQNPVLLDILEIIAEEPLEMIRLLEIMKGTLVNTISHWHADPTSSTSKNPHCDFTVRFINILAKAQWIPHPLSCCGEITGTLTPAELSMLLITMWNFVRDFPPSPDSYVVSKAGKPRRIFAPPARLNVFIRPMRTIVHSHIAELGALYRAYFEPREL